MSQERGPWIDVRMRWRAGMVAVAWAALLGVVALLRPLASTHASPGLRLSVTLAIGLGVAGTALLASLKGRGRRLRRSRSTPSWCWRSTRWDRCCLRSGGRYGRSWRCWSRRWRWPRASSTRSGVAALATLLAAADAAASGFVTRKAALAARLRLRRDGARHPPRAAGREAAPGLAARRAGPARRRGWSSSTTAEGRAGRGRQGHAAPGLGGGTPRPPARPGRRAGRVARPSHARGPLGHRRARRPLLRPRPRARRRRPARARTRPSRCAPRPCRPFRPIRSRSCSTGTGRSTRPTSSGCCGRRRSTAARCAWARCWRCRC